MKVHTTSGGGSEWRLDVVATRRIRGPYINRDRRYVAEWVIKNYPRAQVFYNLRLGLPPREIAAAFPGTNADRMARVWKKTCDAVVITDDSMILVEGELRRPLEALGELLVYRDLLSTTPELQPYLGRKVRTVLLCPVEDPSLDLQLRELGIEKAVFRPPWVEDYLREVNR